MPAIELRNLSLAEVSSLSSRIAPKRVKLVFDDEIAALFELIELGASDEKPLREQSVFLAGAVTAHTIAR